MNGIDWSSTDVVLACQLISATTLAVHLLILRPRGARHDLLLDARIVQDELDLAERLGHVASNNVETVAVQQLLRRIRQNPRSAALVLERIPELAQAARLSTQPTDVEYLGGALDRLSDAAQRYLRGAWPRTGALSSMIATAPTRALGYDPADLDYDPEVEGQYRGPIGDDPDLDFDSEPGRNEPNDVTVGSDGDLSNDGDPSNIGDLSIGGDLANSRDLKDHSDRGDRLGDGERSEHDHVSNQSGHWGYVQLPNDGDYSNDGYNSNSGHNSNNSDQSNNSDPSNNRDQPADRDQPDNSHHSNHGDHSSNGDRPDHAQPVTDLDLSDDAWAPSWFDLVKADTPRRTSGLGLADRHARPYRPARSADNSSSRRPDPADRSSVLPR